MMRSWIFMALVVACLGVGWWIYATISAPVPSADDLSPRHSDAEQLNQDEDDLLAAIPSFDVVRVDKDGMAVMAGTATPETRVDIYDGEDLVVSVESDVTGQWAWLSSKPLKEGQMRLTLRAQDSDGRTVYSDEDVIIVVPRRDPKNDAVVVAQKRAGDRTVTILQAPQHKTEFALESIDTGDVVIYRGHAQAGSGLRLYLDNIFAGEATADEDGRWELETLTGSSAASDAHVLRIDRLDSRGNVIKRAEMPFEHLGESITLGQDQEFIIVQPGTSLWRIARHRYGKGLSYKVIHAANADQIKDPDMIYPGQVFATPKIDDRGQEASNGESNP